MAASSVPSPSYQTMAPANLFTAVVRNVFENWQAFKIGTSMAKQSNGMTELMVGATEQCFHENRDLDSGQELGEWIGETLDLNFNLRIEDGSLDEAGNRLVSYWKMYQDQDFSKLREILEKSSLVNPTMNLIPRVEGDESSEEESAEEEGMDIDPVEHESRVTQAESSAATRGVVDADGWTTVTSRRKK